MRETEKWIVYERDDFEEDVETLVEKLTDKNNSNLYPVPKFDGIYGIPVGGLVLAVYLHYRLKLPLLLAPTPRTLIVDDIVDTGKTMSHYIAKGNFTIAIFCKRNGGLWMPNIWLHAKDDKWIHFMWEGPEDGDDRLAR